MNSCSDESSNPIHREPSPPASRFKAELRAIRKRGYAVDNEEREQGLRCIGAPLWDSAGDVVAAISIAGPVFRIGDDRVSNLSASVMRIAARISASLGYRSGRGKHETSAYTD